MSVVGRSLQNAKRANAKACRARYNTILQAQQDIALYGPKEEAEAKKLKSIWETSNMDAFLSIADDRENGYLAERNVRVVVGGAVHIVHRDKVIPQTDDRDWFKLSGDLLTIPKRPQWSFETKPAELERKEKIAFLEWRRTIASLEENHKVLLTPFEKNIEVWRQLWRVVERSDVLLEIVDARNPLAFRCVDFERYAASATNKMNRSKQVVMLINKADLLTENQRMAWAQYFEKRGEKFYFFSAKPLDKTVDHAKAELEDETIATKETNPIEKALQEEEEDPEYRPLDDVDTDEDERIQKLVKNKKDKPRHTSRKLKGAPMQYLNPYELEAMRKAAKVAPRPIKGPEPLTREEIERNERVATKVAAHRSYDILSPEDLLDHMAYLRSSCGIVDDDTPLVVGMVGYPNVGKSSTINAIIGCKKVVVSATPGKTKHFQTLMIPNERRVMLCDCPGLVFPSFASTREQMVCDGVLPIDTVKDYVSPVAVICQRIPRQVFEHMYTVSLLQEDDIDESTCLADRLLNVIARRKGYMTDHDKPNRSKIAKEILKMYVDGVFVYVSPPPGLLLSLPEELEYELGLRQEDLAEEVGETKRARKDALDADDEDEIWEDISSADDARALSQDGDETVDSIDEELNAAPPMFFARPKGANLTQAELFNLETNYLLMPKPEKRVAKKRRTNHQLEPETLLVQNEDGELELAIDSDDGIVEYDPKHLPRSIVKRDKQVSKRKQRREAKKMGLGAPVNPTARVVGFASTL